jgi:hypothetical protein
MISPENIKYFVLSFRYQELTIKLPKTIVETRFSEHTKENLEYWSLGKPVDILSEYGKNPNYLCLNVGKNNTLYRFSIERWKDDIRDDQEFLEKLKVGLEFIYWLSDMKYCYTFSNTSLDIPQTLSEFISEIDTFKEQITKSAAL